MNKWTLKWNNGHETVKANTYRQAVRKLKANPNKIQTGMLVQIIDKKGKVGFWDAREFWKEIEKVYKKVPLPDKEKVT